MFIVKRMCNSKDSHSGENKYGLVHILSSVLLSGTPAANYRKISCEDSSHVLLEFSQVPVMIFTLQTKLTFFIGKHLMIDSTMQSQF